MFSRISSLSLGLATVGVGIAMLPQDAQAALSVLRNGVTWAATFEGDVLPTSSTPGWAIFDKTGPLDSSDGDIYSYHSPATTTAVSYETLDATWTGAGTARTAEIRARVPDAVNQAGDGVGSFILGINNVAYDLRFYSGSLAYNFSTGLSGIATLDTSVFHIYRLTVDQGANPRVNLYIDNIPTPVFSTNDNWFTSTGFDKLVFGDISQGGESGKLDVDYISWTSGVHVPIPEPASLSLLALGALAMRRRR